MKKMEKKPSEFMVRELYSAHEVNSHYDKYGDIYNLGMVLYDMLSVEVNLH